MHKKNIQDTIFHGYPLFSPQAQAVQYHITAAFRIKVLANYPTFFCFSKQSSNQNKGQLAPKSMQQPHTCFKRFHLLQGVKQMMLCIFCVIQRMENKQTKRNTLLRRRRSTALFYDTCVSNNSLLLASLSYSWLT